MILHILSYLYILGFGFLFGMYLTDISNAGADLKESVFKALIISLLWPVIVPVWILLGLLLG